MQPGHKEAAAAGPAVPVERLFPYIAVDVLALGAVRAQLAMATGPLRGGPEGDAAVASVPGAALFVDVSGFSALARSLARSSSGAAGGAVACEKLVSTLNGYFSLLVSALHGRSLEDAIVAFAPATEGRSMQQAASSALAAALEGTDVDVAVLSKHSRPEALNCVLVTVRAISFEKQGIRLQAHTGLGVGDLLVYFLRGTGQRAWSQLLYAGDLMSQGPQRAAPCRLAFASLIMTRAVVFEFIRAVCEAQRKSSGDDIVLSEPALVSLEACSCPPALAHLFEFFRGFPIFGPGNNI
eukprot:tig00000670_g3022.t1